MNSRISIADSEQEILNCYSMMAELRPHIQPDLVEHAKEKNCRQVRLVSRVSRVDAHRFYVRKGMNMEAHYFSMNLE